MPTWDECQELIDRTTRSWTTIENKNGAKFLHKANPSVYGFLPAAGHFYEGERSPVGSACRAWTSKWYYYSQWDNGYAWWVRLTANVMDLTWNGSRAYALSVRGCILPS